MPRRKPRRSEPEARRRRHTAAGSNGNKPGHGTPLCGTSQPGEPKRARIPIRRMLLVASLAVPVTGAVFLFGVTSVFRQVPDEPAILCPPTHPPLGNLQPRLRSYLMTFVTQCDADPDDPDKQYTLGLVYAANRMWERARGYFLCAATLDPTNYLFTFYLGIARAKTGDLDGAIELFHRAVELREGFGPAYHRLGDALLQTGSIEEAGSAFREALAVAPYSAPAYMGLADTMLSMGKYTEAVQYADKALDLYPDDPTANYLIGLAYRAQGRWDLAKRHLEKGANSQKPYMFDPGTKALAAHSKLLGG